MGKMEVIDDDEMVMEEMDYGDEVLLGGDEGEEEEPDDKEEETAPTTEEDRDNMSLLELMSSAVSSNFAFRAAQKGSKRLLSSAKAVTAVGLKGAWIVLSTAIIIGVPMMLAVDNERLLVESQNRVMRQQGGLPPAPPAP